MTMNPGPKMKSWLALLKRSHTSHDTGLESCNVIIAGKERGDFACRYRRFMHSRQFREYAGEVNHPITRLS